MHKLETCMWKIVSNCISMRKTFRQSIANFLYSSANEARSLEAAPLLWVWRCDCLIELSSTWLDALKDVFPSLYNVRELQIRSAFITMTLCVTARDKQQHKISIDNVVHTLSIIIFLLKRSFIFKRKVEFKNQKKKKRKDKWTSHAYTNTRLYITY